MLQDKDPFWDDPSTEQHIGSVHVYLQSLAYQIDVEETLQITDYRGQEQGILFTNIYIVIQYNTCQVKARLSFFFAKRHNWHA